MTEAPVKGPVPRFELTAWRERYGIVAGITGRGNGPAPFDLGLAGLVAPVGEVMARWRAFRDAMSGFPGVVLAHQVHGTGVLWHGSSRGLSIQSVADGHMTDAPGVLLAVTLADCIPVYLVDPVRRTVALLHAGWRGVVAGMLPIAMAELRARGHAVDNLLAHCGVGICGSCYEVGPEVFAQCELPVPAAGRGRLDLRALLVGQLHQQGVENVSTSEFCSAHDRADFFSHRASGGADGRMVAYLGLLA